MPPRASKRLKATAGKVVATATEVETTRKTTTRKVSVAKKARAAAVEQVEESTTTTTTVASATTTKTTKAKANTKAAWGALFTQGAKKTKAVGSDGERVWPRPKRGELSAELQAKIEAFAAFDGVEKTNALKVVAWNVNGVRALLKKDDSVHLRAYVAQEDPDVLCLSETKIDIDELQKLEDLLPQYEYQYWSSAAKKGYAGTAVLSKIKPLSVRDEILLEGKPDDEGRFLALEFESFWLIHTYVPNSGMKLDRLGFRTEQWDKAMLAMMQELEKTKPVVWCGDLNVAHQEIDIHDPKSNRNRSPGFTDAERESFSDILAHGYVDAYRHLNPEKAQYTYFSYRFNAKAKNKGWRLDYFVISKALLDRMETSFVREAVSGSDHIPIGLELKRV